jgi:hypothetical protein
MPQYHNSKTIPAQTLYFMREYVTPPTTCTAFILTLLQSARAGRLWLDSDLKKNYIPVAIYIAV